MHEFGLSYVPEGPRRRSHRPLVRVVLFLVVPLAYYVWVIASFQASDRRLLELDAEIAAVGGQAERAEKLLKRMAAGAAEDAPLIAADLLAPRPAGSPEVTLADLGPRTWPATSGRAERYVEAAAEARLAARIRARGVRAVLEDFRSLPEVASGEVALVEFAVGVGPGGLRRAALAAEAPSYAPLRRLVDRLVADPRFRDLAVVSAARDGAVRRVELEVGLAEGGR